MENKTSKTLYFLIGLLVIIIVMLVFANPWGGQIGWNMIDGANHQNMGGMQNHMITSKEQFVFEMIPHHQEAVDTSRIILASTQNEPLRTLTQNIISAQDKEISMMNNWKNQWYPRSKYTANYRKMMPRLEQYNGTSKDRAYLEGMIMHHNIAIMMAQQVLKLNPRDEVVQLANEIVRTQNDEVKLMRQLLSN
jgi:uncharacterized protein (DUF305 family)